MLCKVDISPVVWGEHESMTLFEEATRSLDDKGDARGASWGQPGVIEKAVEAIEELVETTTNQHVTREDVDRNLGTKIDRVRWTKIDRRFTVHRTVSIERGVNNRVLYKKISV